MVCNACKMPDAKFYYRADGSMIRPCKRCCAVKVSLWQRLNPERARAKCRRWLAAHRDEKKSMTHRRLCGYQPENFSAKEWSDLKARYGHLCVCCQTPETSVHRLTVDHIVPRSLGGSNAIENVQPLCARCNGRKQDFAYDFRVQHDRIATELGRRTEKVKAMFRPSLNNVQTRRAA